MTRLFIHFLVSSCFIASPALACDFDDKDGLDVGLVLSGGGAKSSTQVGVMQILDELDIPIHCIAGSSMGAVVGSFYASGYTADEIADIFVDEDWGAVFRGDIERADKAFIQKEREETYFSGDILGLNNQRLELPEALNSMQGLKVLYRNILQDIPLDTDFDDLPIPFRAVGTNLETGGAVAFGEGDLVSAILASMAVPGVFAPRMIDGIPYVDGGVSTNLPVKTIQEMGADIIIALDTTAAPLRSDGRYSIGETLQQITTILVYTNAQRDKENLSDQDLYIEPNTIEIPTAAYDRSEEGLAAGREAGRRYREELLKIKALAAPPLSRTLPYEKDPELVTLEFSNSSSIDDEVLKNRVKGIFKNGKLSADKDRRLRELASFGGFGEVDLGHKNGEAILAVSPNSMGKTRLKVGANAANNFDGGASFSLLAQVTRQPISRHGGDISLSAELGTDNGLSLELYQPFGPGSRYFIQPEIFIRNDKRELDIGETRLGDFTQQTQGIRARLGREISSWGLVALEAEVKNERLDDIVTAATDFQTETYSFGSLGAYFAADTLDRTDWPTHGQRIQLRAQRFFDISEGGALDGDKFEASWLHTLEAGSYEILLNGRYGRLNTKETILGFDSLFELGGFRKLSAFRESSLPTDEFAYGSVEIFKRLSSEGFLVDIPVYVGGIAEYGRYSVSFFETNQGGQRITGETEDAISAALYIGSETPLGAAFLGTAYGNSNDIKVFFRFGQTF